MNTTINSRLFKHGIFKCVDFLIKVALPILKPIRHYLLSLREIIRYTIWKNKLGSLGKNSKIYPYVVIHSPKHVKIGFNVSIAEFVHIWGGGGG